MTLTRHLLFSYDIAISRCFPADGIDNFDQSGVILRSKRWNVRGEISVDCVCHPALLLQIVSSWTNRRDLLLANLFHDEQKVHTMDPESTPPNVWDDGDDLTFQAVQELLQFALITRHFEIKTMDAIFIG
jgi:hypothetical protein